MSSPPRMRRLPPHLRGRPPRLPRRPRAHPPPGARGRPRRRPGALRAPRPRRSRACSRRPPPMPRRRPTRRCSCRSSSPVASTCSTRSCPLHDYGRYADLHPQAEGGRARRCRRAGFGINPRWRAGVRGGIKGLFERGKIGFLPGIDYANPDLSHFHSRHFWETGPDHRQTAPGLARPLARPLRRPRQPASGRLDGLGALAGDALRPRAGGRGGLARRRRLLDPRRLGRALRRGDGRLRAPRAAPRRRPRAAGVAHRGAAGQAGGRPPRALHRARRRRSARVHDRLPGGERLRRPGCATWRP